MLKWPSIDRMKTLFVYVEDIQVEDLGVHRYPKGLEVGFEIECQLHLTIPVAPYAFYTLGSKERKGLSTSFRDGFIRQPIPGWPLTEVVAKVDKVTTKSYDLVKGEQWRGETYVGMILEADETRLVSGYRSPGSLPRSSRKQLRMKGEFVHTFGWLGCDVSFTGKEGFSPTQARVVEVRRFDGKWGFPGHTQAWGIVKLEIDSGIRRPKIKVDPI